MKSLYNLPTKVVFCKKCVLSNQRPSSIPEFKHKKNRDGAKYLNISENSGVCDACRVAESKEKSIDWEKREKELLEIRESFKSSTLAELYDPISMPTELKLIHNKLDAIVYKAFNIPKGSPEDIVLETLFSFYLQQVSEQIQ